jgi:hypothetical protein
MADYQCVTHIHREHADTEVSAHANKAEAVISQVQRLRSISENCHDSYLV